MLLRCLTYAARVGVDARGHGEEPAQSSPETRASIWAVRRSRKARTRSVVAHGGAPFVSMAVVLYHRYPLPMSASAGILALRPRNRPPRWLRPGSVS